MIGWNPGPQDGDDGPRTRLAVSGFQAASAIPENGAWDDPATQATLADALRSTGWAVI
jgi:peptidoglycan hydrolase-like protein with peptidoglycan-binding domain